MPLAAVLGDHEHLLSWDHDDRRASLVLAHAVDHDDEHDAAGDARHVVSPEAGDPSPHPLSGEVTEVLGLVIRSEIGGVATFEEPLAMEDTSTIPALRALQRTTVRPTASPPPPRLPRTVILLI